jgi:spore coat polysaccharide biosynthesis protein SpsF
MPADKPLLDPNVVDQVISEFNNNNYDYITTFLPSTFPSGTEVEVFTFSALEKAWKESVLPSEREHVTPYIHKNPEKFQISNFENDIDLSNFRWAVDEKDDLLFVKKIVSKLNKKPILINDILNVIKNEPKIFEINLNVNRNAGDKKSTKEDIEFLKNREKQNE